MHISVRVYIPHARLGSSGAPWIRGRVYTFSNQYQSLSTMEISKLYQTAGEFYIRRKEAFGT